MVKRLQDIWSSDQCNPPRAECFNRLANAMNEDQALEIEKRRIGSWYNQWGRYGARAGLFTALVSFYSWYWRTSQAQPPNFIAAASYHVPSTDLAQWSSAGDASTVVFSADKTAITVPVSVSMLSSMSTATATTLTADASGHKSGDVLVAIPTDTANAFEELIRMTGQCKDTPVQNRRRAVPSWDAINGINEFMIPMAAPDQLFHGFGLASIANLPTLTPEDGEAADSLAAAQRYAEGRAEFENVDETDRRNIVQVIWQGVLQFCQQHTADLTTIALDGRQMGNGSETTACSLDDDDDEPECPDPECVGIKEKCTAGKYKDCSCFFLAKWFDYPSRQSDWDLQQQILVNAWRDVELNSGKCEAQITQSQGTCARGGCNFLYAVKVSNQDGIEIGNKDRTVLAGDSSVDVTSQLPHVFIIKSNPGTDGGIHMLYAGEDFYDSTNDATKSSYCEKPGVWTQSGSPVRLCPFLCPRSR